jgi:Leucine-rich repeat (LRR) protein
MKIRIRFRERGESHYARGFLSSLNLDPARWEEEQVADSLATPIAVIFGPRQPLGFPLDAVELTGDGTWDCHFESDRDCSRFCVNGRVLAAYDRANGSEADLTERLSRLPEDLIGLRVGCILGLSKGSFPTVLNTISKFEKLKLLEFRNLKKSIVDWNGLSKLTLLERLVLSGCGSDQLTLNSVGTLTQLRSLNLNDAGSSLVDLSPLSGLDHLAELCLSSDSLTDLHPLAPLQQLKSLELWGCKSLVDLHPLGRLRQLTSLNLEGSECIRDLRPISTLTKLTTLNLNGCELSTDLQVLSNFTELKALHLSRRKIWSARCFESFSEIAVIASLPKLEQLDLSDNSSLTDFTPLSGLVQLRSLNLSGCHSVTNLSGLPGLARLDSLDLKGCSSLTDVSKLSDLVQLRSLNLSGCHSVTNLSGLSGLDRLDSLDLGGCSSLADLTPLANLSELSSLILTGCNLINDLAPLSSLSKLERLDLSDLRRLRSIEPLRELVSLREIKTNFHPSVVGELEAHLAALRSDTSVIDESSDYWLSEAIAFTDGQPFEQERFAATLGEAFSLLDEHEIVPPYQAFLDSRPDFSAVPWKAWLQGCAKNRGHHVMAREVERVPPEQLSPGGVGGRCAVLPGEDAPPDWQDWARDWLGRLERAQSSRAQQLLPVSAELCLAHARLGLREALERWLKRFTDPSDTAALDPVQAALGEWQLQQGDTRAALAHALAVQQPGCRDPLLVRLVEAMHGDEAEQAGEILLRIESESLRRDLALKLVQLDSFAALPANMERLIVACGSSPAMLAELIRLAAPGADPSHLSALSNRLRSTSMDADC